MIITIIITSIISFIILIDNFFINLYSFILKQNIQIKNNNKNKYDINNYRTYIILS